MRVMSAVPRAIEALFAAAGDPARLLDALMPACGRALACQRILLFLRHPLTRQACCTHGWWETPAHAFPRDAAWRREPAALGDDDPMFAAALRDPAALYVGDIETAGPELLNRDYERREFRHRALIHAPLWHDGGCWGILEPCVFDAPRLWTESDRALTEWLQARLGPLAAAHVERHAPR